MALRALEHGRSIMEAGIVCGKACTMSAATLANKPTACGDVIFVLGGPGSGKGTQSERLSKEFGMPHFSAGDLLRHHIQSGSPEGRELAELINQGRIVPSSVTISLLQKAMRAHPSNVHLIDGFPRNLENAQAWSTTTGIEPRLVYNFIVSEADLEKRLLNRGQSRSDDNILTIKKRFKTFQDSTLPVLEYYRSKGLVQDVPAHEAPDEVYKRVRRVFISGLPSYAQMARL